MNGGELGGRRACQRQVTRSTPVDRQSGLGSGRAQGRLRVGERMKRCFTFFSFIHIIFVCFVLSVGLENNI